MSVYVDIIMPCIPNKNWPYKQACHLLADSVSELHRFAETLGLKKQWLQWKKGSVPHFDLTPSMRKKAVKQGAIEISNSEFVQILREWRRRNG